MTPSPNPLVAEIATELNTVDGVVDEMIVFVLDRAASKIRDRAFDDRGSTVEDYQLALRIAGWIDPARTGRD